MKILNLDLNMLSFIYFNESLYKFLKQKKIHLRPLKFMVSQCNILQKKKKKSMPECIGLQPKIFGSPGVGSSSWLSWFFNFAKAIVRLQNLTRISKAVCRQNLTHYSLGLNFNYFSDNILGQIPFYSS